MQPEPPIQRVEVRFVGAPPAERVRRASGVSEVYVEGATLRCVVWGSFQPFLEALRGHEVLHLTTSDSAAISTHQRHSRDTSSPDDGDDHPKGGTTPW